MTRSDSPKRAQDEGPLRGRKAVGGRGLGKAGARRLGKMLKRVIQGDQDGKGKVKNKLPTTLVRLLKQKAQSIQTETSEGKPDVAAHVSQLILKVIAQCKRRGGMSMVELKQALAAGGYDVTKNTTRVNLAMTGLVRKESIVQTAGQGISGSFKINKKLKRDVIRTMRKTDAGIKLKPQGQYEKEGQRQPQKGVKAAAQRPKTARKDVRSKNKAQSQAVKNHKSTHKAAPITKRKSNR